MLRITGDPTEFFEYAERKMSKDNNVKVYEVPEGFRDDASACDGDDDGNGCIAEDVGKARFPWRQLGALLYMYAFFLFDARLQ